MSSEPAKSAPIPSAASKRRAFSSALGGLIAIAAGIGVGRFVYTPILPPMIAALGLSKSAAGLIASANFLGYLTGALLVAMPTLRGSRHGWLLGALATSALTTAAMGLAQGLPAFLFLRLVGGAASAFVLILASTAVLEELAETGHGELSALHFAGVGSGIAISAALVAALLSLGQEWRALWLASGVLALVGFTAAALLLPRRSPATPHRDGPAGGHAGRAFQRFVAAYGLYGFGYIITATFLIAIVRSTPAIREWEPVIWVVFGLAAVPSVALWTWIARPLGIPWAFALACIVEAVGVMASVGWQSTAGVFTAAVLVGGTFMGLTALGLLGARNLATGDPRRAMAMITGAFGVGQIVGPVFAGFVSDRLNSFTLPSAAAAAALLVAAVLAVL